MKEYSETFCVYPWVQQMAHTGGRAGFCCIAKPSQVQKDGGGFYELATDPLGDAWNSQFMRDLRRDMLAGTRIDACSTCYFQEEIGKRSYREMHNAEWAHKLGAEAIERRVDNSIANDYAVDEPAVYLDLRLGNLCNLKCRMCNPFNSTAIAKEWDELDADMTSGYSEFWQTYGMSKRDIEPWYESETFWTSVESFIPHLTKVYMTGGEPTLIAGNYRFLQRCIDLGYAGNIELFFNLNFTNITPRFVDLIHHFRWTGINASFDGVGRMNDYIRGNSHWTKLKENFLRLARDPWGNVGLGLSPVIQVYNVLDLVPIFEFVEEVWAETQREITVDFLYNTDPPFLDVSILPETVKKEALGRMVAYRDRSRLYGRNSKQAFFVKNSIDSFINLMEQRMFQEDPKLIREFLRYTDILDTKRGQKLAEAAPDLTRLLAERGYV